jgi:hypothetical protein
MQPLFSRDLNTRNARAHCPGASLPRIATRVRSCRYSLDEREIAVGVRHHFQVTRRTRQMPMNVSPQSPNKRKLALLAVAVLLLAFAGAALAMGGNDATIRTLAMLAVVFSVYCVRLQNAAWEARLAGEALTTSSEVSTPHVHPLVIVSDLGIPLNDVDGVPVLRFDSLTGEFVNGKAVRLLIAKQTVANHLADIRSSL